MHKNKPPKARPIRQIKIGTSLRMTNNVRPKTVGKKKETKNVPKSKF
jgi:hypothetical protein